ncbi:MAG TPA: ATP-binding protein, partial [Longimicrobiales bacterium]|nr:ATP-binding protein [Longimicrobiales bacterium]
GRAEQARRNLRELVGTAPASSARVYDESGAIAMSADPAEEGTRRPGIWMPSPRELPTGGMVRRSDDQKLVIAYLPIGTPRGHVLAVEFSVAPVQAAMQRGARLGLGLVIASLLVMAALLFSIIQREVIMPFQRITADQQRKLREQAGLAEVGELAAEMAHEFKRPLVSIQTAVALLEQEYVLDEHGKKLLLALDGQIDKLSETMRDLFALAKPLAVESTPVDIRDVIDGALMQTAPAAEHVRVRLNLEPDLPPVIGDRRRLEQALANLITNATEAMPQDGTLTINAARLNGDVWLRVTDTGSGIPEAKLKDVLRPFYSTKPLGTGLGLPLVARIVAAHGGELTIESALGKGTTVNIRLPSTAQGTWPGYESSSSTMTTSSARS